VLEPAKKPTRTANEKTDEQGEAEHAKNRAQNPPKEKLQPKNREKGKEAESVKLMCYPEGRSPQPKGILTGGFTVTLDSHEY
jgi:hypothetical protein